VFNVSLKDDRKQGDQIFKVQKRVKEYTRRVQKKGVLFVLFFVFRHKID
jgi:hypothetical protein